MYREIQKLVAFLGSFLVVFLSAYLCQILKEIDLIILVNFAFLVHVMIRKLQGLDWLLTVNIDVYCSNLADIPKYDRENDKSKG